MNLKKPQIICKATKHIPEMIKLVKTLIDKGYAYQISDGIYFDTVKFKNYGKLSGNTLDQLKDGARIEVNPEKKNPADFALWKFSEQKEKRQMEWPAFGKKGFPGWHIECSAMSMKYLGPNFDFHTGGEDNIFPHHECEIAQSEAATGKKFVNFWLHSRFLMVEGEKMSKSKHNFYTLKDLHDKGFQPLDLRYLFLTSHYRSQMNFTWQGLSAASVARGKFGDFILGTRGRGKIIKEYQEQFYLAVNDDLDMPKALALVWVMLKSNHKAQDIKATILDFDRVLGLGLSKLKPAKVPRKIKKMANERLRARNEKNYTKADQLRQEMEKLGFVCEDQNNCFIIKPLKK
jgi:cysteinyl-tRNA synthetase